MDGSKEATVDLEGIDLPPWLLYTVARETLSLEM
jgi:hypothetical protein